MNALFLGTPDDKPYLPYLKSYFKGVTTYVHLDRMEILSHLELHCRPKNVTRVVSTNTDILSKLLALQGNIKSEPKLSEYAGSLFEYKGIEIVFISPLAQLFSVKYGKFLCSRYISKVVSPGDWNEPTPFTWALGDASSLEGHYRRFREAYVIACDIETFRDPLSIRCIGYTGIFITATGSLESESVVFPIDSEANLVWMRKFNDLPAPKIFQRGVYDNAYLLRYNAPARNWYWDTASLFHSWYSELPKDLAFLNAFFLRKVVYWKDLAETSDLFEYYRYNALDTWATANVWIVWLLTAPAWARKNYTLKFPKTFPCILAEMTGMIRDQDRLLESRAQVDKEEEEAVGSLRKMLAAPTFNPGSPVQVKSLLKVLGCGDITSTEEKELNKAAYRHPLNSRILNKILDVRGLRKLRSTYLRTDDDAKQTGIHAGEGGAKEFKGTWLYTQNPDGTDTARLSSGEHHFWCGANVQNVPARAGSVIKRTIRAPAGFWMAECDLEQAESRDTAHIAGDESLIRAVSGTRDFHSINASAFFGRSYDSIYDDTARKTKDKALRDLAKRVNHGANYNMGAGVLVDTMGLENIWLAKKFLGISATDPKEIATYLLDKFHATYTKLRGPNAPFTAGTYYAWVVESVEVSRRLTSRAFHHTAFNERSFDRDAYIAEGDWTRYCFGDPRKNKLDLNAYTAHCPQSLNARTLNEAFMQVFYDIALQHPETFRLYGQIHDSIPFAYAHGHEYLADMVKERMEIPVSVQGVDGKTRKFIVPAALKLGKMKDGTLVRATYWSETE